MRLVIISEISLDPKKGLMLQNSKSLQAFSRHSGL